MKTLYITLGIVFIFYLIYRIYRMVTIDKGLERRIKNGAIVLDVRTSTEYKTGHIDGSINISLGTIREKHIELDKFKTYITCCSHGLRSVKAETILKDKGFKNVYNGGTWTDLEKLIHKTKS